jgi:hypothetical protein
MRPGLHEAVGVLAGYSQKQKIFRPLILTWNGIDYSLGKIDFYHKTKQGVTTLHHFSLSTKDESVYFKLVLNGNNLSWTLEEYMMAGATEAHYTV